MSKKSSSVNLKNGFKNFKDLSNIFLNFKNKLDRLNKKAYTVAVSGGPDSLALVALTKAYLFTKKTKFHYVLVDHDIRKKSAQSVLDKVDYQIEVLKPKYYIPFASFSYFSHKENFLQNKENNSVFDVHDFLLK